MSESKLTNIIREYLSDAELKETLHDPKLELGYRFEFPKGKNPQGKPIGRPFTVVKAKNKNCLEISSPVNISPEHKKVLEPMEEGTKERFFKKLAKIFVLKEVFFDIDMKNYRYAIIDNVFLDKNKVVSRNLFYDRIRKVLGCVLYSIFELQDFCSGEFDASDLKLIF